EREDVGKYLRTGLRRREADGRLVLAVSEEQRVQQVAVDARIEQAVARADHGAVVQGIRQADTRREVLVTLADASRLRPIRIGNGRLRQPGLFVAHPIPEGDLLGDL